jgi:multidrug efflux pump subunit AcrB
VVLEKLAALPQLQDVTGDLQATAPRLMLKLDRDVIGRLGLSPQLIDDTLYDAFGQRQVAVVFGLTSVASFLRSSRRSRRTPRRCRLSMCARQPDSSRRC